MTSSVSWNYLFGPVPSRRLGQSLGVDIIPSKLCTLDCIYCEVGLTDKRGIARKEYYPVEEILAEIRRAVKQYPRLDHITFSGSGEPTLHSGIGQIIRGIKSFTDVPVAVLTNGTLLTDPAVRSELMEADIVSPSLDAASQEIFERIDRPHPQLHIADIIDGLVAFRAEFTGKLWLEILFVRGVNDGEDEIQRLKNAIDRIRPDVIQLNTVVRPPAEPTALPVPERRLREISALFGEKSEVIGVYQGKAATTEHGIDAEQIIALLRRRAMRLEEMSDAMEMHRSDLVQALDELCQRGKVERVPFGSDEFFQIPLISPEPPKA